MQKYFILSQLRAEISQLLDTLALSNAMLTAHMAKSGEAEISFTQDQLIGQRDNPVRYTVDGDRYIATIDKKKEEQTELGFE